MGKFNKILFVCIAISAISFSSCKKPIDPIVGTWVLAEKKIEITTSNQTYAAILNQILNTINIDNYMDLPNTLILNENGTGNGITSKVTWQFNYTKTDKQITFEKMAVYIGGNSNDDLVADYLLLNDNKTLKATIDVTNIGKDMLRSYANGISTPIDVEGLIGTISKINAIATYNKLITDSKK